MTKYVVVYDDHYRLRDGRIPLLFCLCKSCGTEASYLVRYATKVEYRTEVFCDAHGRIKLLELEMRGISINEEL